MPIDLYIGDVVRLRKPHPCGSFEWTIVRLGADIGLRCEKCAHRVMLPRTEVERRLVRFVSRPVRADPFDEAPPLAAAGEAPTPPPSEQQIPGEAHAAALPPPRKGPAEAHAAPLRPRAREEPAEAHAAPLRPRQQERPVEAHIAPLPPQQREGPSEAHATPFRPRQQERPVEAHIAPLPPRRERLGEGTLRARRHLESAEELTAPTRDGGW